MRPIPVRHALRSWLAPGLIFVALGACDSDDPVSPGPRLPAPVWSEVSDLPPVFTTFALWAPDPDYVLAVGPAGLVRSWDGQRWSPVANESGNDLYAIAGDAVGPIVAVGDGGRAVRYGASGFEIVPTPTAENLRGVWMAERDDFFAVGDGGAVLRGDGSAWELQVSGTLTPLYSLWGSAANDVFAVGLHGTIRHFDGVSWSSMTSGTTEILAAVGGTDFNDVYAVGGHGTILHYDGAAWQPMASGTTELLQSVWAPGGPIAVGGNGTILRLHNGAWVRDAGVTRAWLYGVARAGDRAWAMGANDIRMHDGIAWQSPTRGAIPVQHTIAALPQSELLLAGDDGYLARGREGQWHIDDTGSARRLNAVWVSPAGELFAVGVNRILRYDGANWVSESSELAEFHDIDGAGNTIYAVGDAGRIRLRGLTSWGVASNGSVLSLYGLAMASETEGYAVGQMGLVHQRNQYGLWVSMTSHTQLDLYDVIITPEGPHRAIAVGASGTIRALTLPTPGWEAMNSPTSSTLHALAWGPGGLLYAVGAGGTVIRLQDGVWVTVPAPTGRPLLAACTRGETLFITGGDSANGAILFRYGRPPAASGSSLSLYR